MAVPPGTSMNPQSGMRWQVVIWREGEMWDKPDKLLEKFLKTKALYKCYAEHIGEKSGKKHFHCYLRFSHPRKREALMVTFGQNIRKMDGDDYDNAKYISEDGKNESFWEEGTKKRFNEQQTYIIIDELLKSGKSLHDIIIEYPQYRGYCNQNKWVLGMVDNAYSRKRERDDIEVPEQLYPWQQHVLRMLELPAHPRHIYWYMDCDGDQGKSVMDDILFKNQAAVSWMPTGDDAHSSQQLLERTNGRAPENIVIDLAAGDARKICWAAVERAKNGRAEGQMFKCERSYRGKRPRIFVFSNENPTGCPLTANRIVLYKIVNKEISEESVI